MTNETQTQNPENNDPFVKDQNQKTALNAELQAAIMLAVDLESTFKLYSYRCLSPESFIERTKHLVDLYTSDTTKS